MEDVYKGIRRLKREADSSAEVKNAWSCTSNSLHVTHAIVLQLNRGQVYVNADIFLIRVKCVKDKQRSKRKNKFNSCKNIYIENSSRTPCKLKT